MAALVEIEKAGHVATVTLNRPRVFNAFDRGVIGRLAAVAEELGANPAVRAIVIIGAGATSPPARTSPNSAP